MMAFNRIEKHYKLSDEEFEQDFKTCQLNPVLFTHEAHLRLAFIHITKYGEQQAIENIRKQLKKYVIYAGAVDKYHDTVTVISIKEMARRIKKSKHTDFKAFILEFPEFLFDFKTIVNSRYSFDVFQSKEAKVSYMAPDKNLI